MKLRKPRTRAGWIVAALVIANEIRGIFVVATLAPSLFKAAVGG